MFIEYVIVLIVAYAIRSIFGFGSALVAVPALHMLTDMNFMDIVILISVCDISTSLFQLKINFYSVLWSEVGKISVPMAIGVLLGVELLSGDAENPDVKMLLGYVLVIYGILNFFGIVERFYGKLEGPFKTWLLAIVLGGGSGFFGFLFAIQAPACVIYLQLRGVKNQDAYLGTLAILFLIGAAFRMIAYGGGGFISFDLLPLIFGTVLVVLPIISFGKQITRFVSRKEDFKRILNVPLILAGIHLTGLLT